MLITIVGRLTGPPSLRFTGSGKAVCNLTVAENHRKKDPAGNWQDGTPTFWDCTAWEQTAENIAEADLTKGTRVVVVGDSYTEAFKRKDGSDGKAMRVKITEVGSSLRGFPGQAQHPPADDPWGTEPPF